MQNSIFKRHYLNYLEIKNNNKILTSQYLNDIEIKELYNKKYQLTEFDIYKYLTALDSIKDSLNSNITLTEGIIYDKNIFNNILIDLYYHNVPHKIIYYYPISLVFGIKQIGQYIQDLSEKDINSWKGNMYWNPYYLDLDDINFYQEIKTYQNDYSNYSGNSYTYYIFKQLIKLLLTEVYLYEYKSQILTYIELMNHYKFNLNNHPEPSNIKTITQLIESGDIKKIKYQCIKVSEPEDIYYLSL